MLLVQSISAGVKVWGSVESPLHGFYAYKDAQRKSSRSELYIRMTGKYYNVLEHVQNYKFDIIGRRYWGPMGPIPLCQTHAC